MSNSPVSMISNSFNKISNGYESNYVTMKHYIPTSLRNLNVPALIDFYSTSNNSRSVDVEFLILPYGECDKRMIVGEYSTSVDEMIKTQPQSPLSSSKLLTAWIVLPLIASVTTILLGFPIAITLSAMIVSLYLFTLYKLLSSNTHNCESRWNDIVAHIRAHRELGVLRGIPIMPTSYKGDVPDCYLELISQSLKAYYLNYRNDLNSTQWSDTPMFKALVDISDFEHEMSNVYRDHDLDANQEYQKYRKILVRRAEEAIEDYISSITSVTIENDQHKEEVSEIISQGFLSGVTLDNLQTARHSGDKEELEK